MTVREGNGLRADFVKKAGQINDSLVNGSQSGYDPGADPKLGAEICRLKKKESGSYSGGLVKVDSPDAAADALAVKIGGELRVKFANDPNGREFDVVSSEYIVQAKPDLSTYGKSWRKQTKATFEAAQETGRKAYFQFEGQPDASIIRKIAEYGER